jgi:hypothetical protein
MRDPQYLKGRTVWSALAAICESAPQCLIPPFERRSLLDSLEVLLSTMMRSILKCSLLRTFAIVTHLRSMQKCFQITTGKELFVRSCASWTAMETAP